MGDAPSWRIYEDDRAVAFLDISQATEGHSLVVPREHAVNLFTLSEDSAAALGRAVHRVARLLHERLDPPGMNVVQSNGRAAWQEVPHVHVHVVPRYLGDGLVPPWGETNPSHDALRVLHARIAAS